MLSGVPVLNTDEARQLLESAGWGQREFARHIGFSEGKFREMMRGSREIPPYIADSIVHECLCKPARSAVAAKQDENEQLADEMLSSLLERLRAAGVDPEALRGNHVFETALIHYGTGEFGLDEVVTLGVKLSGGTT